MNHDLFPGRGPTPASLCNEQSALVDLLYDECDPEERRRLEAHVAVCAACAGKLQELRAVRADLQAWTPPERALGFRVVQDRTSDVLPAFRLARLKPGSTGWGWAMAAAAVLVLAVGAAIANVEVRYGGDGLTLRTGWNRSATPAGAAAQPRGQPTTAQLTTVGRSPWRADLASLERQLRREFANMPASSTPAPVVVTRSTDRATAERDADLLRRVRALIEESERRQQRELALRLTDVAREFEATRRADLVRIERGLVGLERETGAEVRNQRELLNYLVRVSTTGNRQ